MVFLSGLAAAQTVSFDFDQQALEQAGLESEQVEENFGAGLDEDLHLIDQLDYLEDMAIAAALSSHGMGVDYASNPQHFVLGGSMGSAVSGAGARFGRGDEFLPQGGFAFQVSAMGGLNLGALAPDDSVLRRFVIYGNGMALDTQGERFDGRLQNYGGHLQVQLVAPRIGTAVEWGGLALTGGFEFSHYRMVLSQSLPLSQGALTWKATGGYEIESTSMTVPVELSTNVRLAFLTLYVGVGQDFLNSTSVQSNIELTGPITTTVGGNEVTVANLKVAHADGVTSLQPLPRGFAGVQMNLMMLKVYGHLNATVDGGFGGHVGLRLAR